MVNIPKRDRSMFSQAKWGFLLEAPFEVSNKCCNIMKKNPFHEYTKKTQTYGMTAQMASESRLRAQKWLQHGCNMFDIKIPVSNPMSFWTEQDVLAYIYSEELSICSVYGDVVREDRKESPDKIAELNSMELFELNRPALTTTGCERTGCMFCGFGCHREKRELGRFERLKITHPKIYEYIMKPWDEGGLGYKEVIDWLNENGNLNIKY